MMTLLEMTGRANNQLNKLNEVYSYLNEAGLARYEALRRFTGVAVFHDTYEEILRCPHYQALFSVAPNSIHDEYFKVISQIDSAIKREINK